MRIKQKNKILNFIKKSYVKLVIMDGFLLLGWSPSCFDSTCRASSITRTVLVLIWNVVVQKGTGSVPFSQALRTGIVRSRTGGAQISTRSISVRSNYLRRWIEQDLKNEMAVPRQNNQHIKKSLLIYLSIILEIKNIVVSR